MATDFSPSAFLEELESFGKPPPPRQIVSVTSPSTSEIVSKLNALNLDKQKKMRSSSSQLGTSSENGMVSLGKKMGNANPKEEISREEASGLRQMVLSASRPKNPWSSQEQSSVDSGRAYAKEVAQNTPNQRPSSRGSTATASSLPSPPVTTVYSNGNYSDYSSGSSQKSPSPPSTLRNTTNSSSNISSPNYKFQKSPQNIQPINRPIYPPSKVQISPTYKPGHQIEELRYNGVNEQQKMIGKTYSYGVKKENDQSINTSSTTLFPKVDILTNEPSRYTSSPSTSDYSNDRNSSNSQSKFPKNGISYPEYGREKGIGEKSLNSPQSNRKFLTTEERASRWKEIDSALAKQDEKFGRLSAQMRDGIQQIRLESQKAGNCHSCKEPLYYNQEATIAMERKYHPKCFNCEKCGRNLKDLKFYFIDEKFVCQEDFLLAELHKRAEKCAVCKKPIVEMVLQAVGRSFHPNCFTCSICHQCLDGLQFAVDDKEQVYCVNDYHQKYAPRCHSCKKAILPKGGNGETVRVVALGNDYHLECYACEGCGRQLGDDYNERCHPFNGHLLCQSCNRLWKSTGGAPTTDL